MHFALISQQSENCSVSLGDKEVSEMIDPRSWRLVFMCLPSG